MAWSAALRVVFPTTSRAEGDTGPAVHFTAASKRESPMEFSLLAVLLYRKNPVLRPGARRPISAEPCSYPKITLFPVSYHSVATFRAWAFGLAKVRVSDEVRMVCAPDDSPAAMAWLGAMIFSLVWP